MMRTEESDCNCDAMISLGHERRFSDVGSAKSTQIDRAVLIALAAVRCSNACKRHAKDRTHRMSPGFIAATDRAPNDVSDRGGHGPQRLLRVGSLRRPRCDEDHLAALVGDLGDCRQERERRGTL